MSAYIQGEAVPPVISQEHTFPLIGRDELVQLTSAVIGGTRGAPTAVILVGQAGIGKSTLLRHALTAAADGIRVLHLVGTPHPERAYLPVVSVLWPVRSAATALPPTLRRTLDLLFDGADPADLPPASMIEAVFALLEAAAATQPVLIAIDDVDQFDCDTRALLVGVVSRLVGPRVRAVITARSTDVLGGIHRAIHTITVGPLSPDDSAKLLDWQPHQPDPSVRGEIVRWSRGNPLALIEFARAYACNGTTTFHGTTMTEGRAAHHPVFVNQIAGLPADTRNLLMHAAAATGHEPLDVINEAAGYGKDLSHWQPACAAEIVRVTDDGRVEFANALVRSAAYADGHLGARRAAHRALADVTRLKESLRAWHLAAAATAPDETLAAKLEETAMASHCRGMELELARSLQRAAEMSPSPTDAARRYALAASAANFGGDLAWAMSLTDAPLHATEDPDVVGHGALTQAMIHLQSSRPFDAVDVIRTVLDGDRPHDPPLVLALLHTAASSAFYSGEMEHRRLLSRWVESADLTAVGPSRFPLPLSGIADLQVAYVRMYAQTAASPHARPWPFDRRWLHSGSPSTDPPRRLVAGVMAYTCQETAIAARELAGALDQLRASGGLRGFTFAMAPLAWALLDAGRWVDLAHLLGEARSMSAVHSMSLMDREIGACSAQLLAMRGDVGGASAALEAAWASTSPATPPRATEVALHRTAGWVAIASGDFASAYRRFGAMFLEDAEPAHFVVSHVGIADLAWAAARSNHADAVRPLVAANQRQLGSNPPARLRLLLHQAIALTAPDDLAEHHYKLAVFDPAGQEWPVERARARLHYGEWLRRARRPAEARPLLAAALDVFERVGAETFAEIARSELRAAGVAVSTSDSSDALRTLTAQERQILALAASGLTNREIAERLKLSPRTIASHLYHVYPKLGVSRRHELRQFAD